MTDPQKQTLHHLAHRLHAAQPGLRGHVAFTPIAAAHAVVLQALSTGPHGSPQHDRDCALVRTVAGALEEQSVAPGTVLAHATLAGEAAARAALTALTSETDIEVDRCFVDLHLAQVERELGRGGVEAGAVAS